MNAAQELRKHAERKLCEKCQARGLKSTITTNGPAMSTLLAGPNGYWDEQGVYHAPEPVNTLTTPYICSRGHAWAEKTPTW